MLLKGFKLKFKTTDIDFELEIEDVEEKDKDFISDILRMLDRKTTTPLEEIKIEHLKQKYRIAKEGYNISEIHREINGLIKDTKPGSVDNYIAQDVEEEVVTDLTTSEELIRKFEEYNKLMNEGNDAQDPKKVYPTNASSQQNINVMKNENFVDVKENEEDVQEESERDYSIQERKGIKTYQTFYKCENKKCKQTGKRFVRKNAVFVYCYSCGKKMRLKPASKGEFPHKDDFGNIYVAGDFKPSNF